MLSSPRERPRRSAIKRIGAFIESFTPAELKEVPSRAGMTGTTAQSARDWPRARWPAIAGTLRDYIARVAQERFRRMVTKALALTPRGFIPHDVLHLSRLSAQLQVEWRSRDVHPWDRNLSSSWRAELFRDQTLRDTDAAILRLFQSLPDMDVIEIRVLEPHAPNRIILAGTVGRQDVLSARSLSSPGMRLRVMGVRYHTNHGQLAPLD